MLSVGLLIVKAMFFTFYASVSATPFFFQTKQSQMKMMHFSVQPDSAVLKALSMKSACFADNYSKTSYNAKKICFRVFKIQNYNYLYNHQLGEDSILSFIQEAITSKTRLRLQNHLFVTTL